MPFQGLIVPKNNCLNVFSRIFVFVLPEGYFKFEIKLMPAQFYKHLMVSPNTILQFLFSIYCNSKLKTDISLTLAHLPIFSLTLAQLPILIS
jgi:hypothetical protein